MKICLYLYKYLIKQRKKLNIRTYIYYISIYTKTVQQQNIIWTIFWIILLALAFTFNK